MALTNMDSDEMLSMSKPWTEPAHPEYQALARVPLLAAMLPMVGDAHDGLLASQTVASEDLKAEISDKQTGFDFRHDCYRRGVLWSFDAYIELARAENRDAFAAELGELRDGLMPEGLRVVNYSYRQEAGRCEFLRSQLTPEVEQRLAQIPTMFGSLLDVVHKLITAGTELGKLEDERVRAREHESWAGRHARGRLQWVRVTAALRTLINLQGQEDRELMAILARLDELERRADRRVRAMRAGDEDMSPDAGDATTGDTTPGDATTGGATQVS